jgi:diguanylate cyclase (GGDEF)-like protein
MAPKMKLESVDHVSILRKFSVIYALSSILPIVILFLVYVYFQGRRPLEAQNFILPFYFVGLMALASFLFMRQSLSNLHKVSVKLKEALKAPVPHEISIPALGNSEVAMIVEAFNELVKRLEMNISELEKSRHMVLQALEREQMLASTDNLTGIANRRVFYEMTSMEIHKAKRYNRPFSVLLMDIDNFKNVNDTWGHQKGDTLLCSVAKGIRESIRSCDVAARLGGDEFAVLLAEAGKETFETVIPRIKERLQADMQRENWPVTFSVGVAAFSVAPENVDEIMRKVDTLMYGIKHEGKNNVKFEIV